MRTPAWLGSVLLMAATCVACSKGPPKTVSVGPADQNKAAIDAGGAASADTGLPGVVATVVPAMDTDIPDAGSSATCAGLQCQQHACTDGASTTISGHVYDPAAKNPLYNIVVYVPNTKVEPLSTGASCNTCDELYTGHPIASALTDATGKFVLSNAPDGANIPLVVQVGKWRRRMTVVNVVPCVDNQVPDGSLRLPKNQLEGDLPNIAISTGGADTLECLLARIGVDRAEYVPGPGTQGHIHIYQGGGTGLLAGYAPNTDPPAPVSATALWDKADDLMQYDIVLLSCEGTETREMNQQALHDYASAGGRVFASHYHYAWFNTGPYGLENLAQWTPGSGGRSTINAHIVKALPSGEVFPKGVALEQWLRTVQALATGTIRGTPGAVPVLQIRAARHNADVSAANTPSQAWIVSDDSPATQYFSFNTPTDAAARPDGTQYCGRVVFSDLHVGAASDDQPDLPVPSSCADADLSPQEKALEFMLFDLSSCVIPDSKPPVAPVVIPPI